MGQQVKKTRTDPVNDPEAESGHHVRSSPLVPEDDVGRAVLASLLSSVCTVALVESSCISVGTWGPQLSSLCSDRLRAPLGDMDRGEGL